MDPSVSSGDDSEVGDDVQIDDKRDSLEILDLAWQVVLSDLESSLDLVDIAEALEDEALTEEESMSVCEAVEDIRSSFASVARASLAVARR